MGKLELNYIPRLKKKHIDVQNPDIGPGKETFNVIIDAASPLRHAEFLTQATPQDFFEFYCDLAMEVLMCCRIC